MNKLTSGGAKPRRTSDGEAAFQAKRSSLDFEDDLIDRAGVRVAIRHRDFQHVFPRCERLESNACAVRNAGQIGTGVNSNWPPLIRKTNDATRLHWVDLKSVRYGLPPDVRRGSRPAVR